MELKKLDNFNSISGELTDYIETEKIKRLKKREDYKKVISKLKEIKEKYPKVRAFVENNEISDFTKTEMQAILEIIVLHNNLTEIELEETFKLGLQEGKML